MKRLFGPLPRVYRLLVSSAVVFVVIAALLGATALSLRVIRLQRTVTALNEGLSEEIERQHQLSQLLESNQRAATGQLQEVRRLLNLPTRDFRFSSTDEQPEAEQDPSVAFFRALDRLVLHHQHRDLRRELPEILGASPLREQELIATPAERKDTWIIRDGRLSEADHRTVPPLFTLRISGTAPPAALSVEPLHGSGTSITHADDSEGFSARLIEALSRMTPDAREFARRYQEAKKLILDAVESPDVRRALQEEDLQIRIHRESYPVGAIITDADGERLLQLDLVPEDVSIRIDGAPLEMSDLPNLAQHLTDRIALLGAAAEHAPPERAARNRLTAIAEDSAFMDYLEQRNLRLIMEPRETLDFLVFEIRDAADTVLGSFAILKNSGELYLLDEDDVMITGLQTLTGEAERMRNQPVASSATGRALPDTFPPGFRASATREGTDLLLVGSHENKADAIMLVHLSPDRTISLISIPRDIYYEGRKLGYHYELYGARTFTRQVGEVIGRSIDGYIAVDMYAFIEIVNLLGGISITLDEPLVDPTYRVRNDGEWGTLHYPAGTHQLNGIEALRIARSRATTNDFVRSSRQQDILDALRRRINELHAGNLDQVYRLFRTLYEYVDTDLGLWELAQYFLAYRNAPIVTQTGMTFDNILYATYSNVHNRGLTMEEIEDEEDFFLGLWILLPRGDDWDVIPWFVEQQLQS